MGQAKRTLAIVAFTTTTLVSCASPKAPTTASTAPPQKVRIYATTAVFPLASELLKTYGDTVVPVSGDVQSGNLAFMMELLMEGGSGGLLATYLPVNENLWAVPVATDGIAIIAHHDVDVQSLTIEELRAIYQGRITNWSELGGDDRDILVFGREQGSGTRLQFEHMVMGRRGITASSLLVSSSQQMLDRIADSPGSLGYVAWAIVDDEVQIIEVDGVRPSIETISTSSYPLRATIYFAAQNEPDADVIEFLRWVQSLEGQEIVSQRYVPINMPKSD